MSLRRDVTFAARMLLKDRWFTAMAAVVLALGIGANNAVFTIVNAVLLRSLPFDEPQQLMAVMTHDARGRENGVSLSDFDDWRRATHTFSNLSFVWSGSFNVSDEGRLPEQYPGAYVSANFFKMLGVSPMLGRDFGPDDDGPGGPPVVMLSNDVWQQRYGADPAVLGRTIRLNGITGTVIGVMPDGMKFPFNEALWVPTSQIPAPVRRSPRQARGYMAIGRLADHVTVEQARSDLRSIGARLERDYPATNKGIVPYAEPFASRVVGPEVRLLFWTLMGAVAFVLLIACANVANLLLARAAARSNEIGVRVALGAARWQIVRQLLVESVALALLAGTLGLLLSIAGIKWFDAEVQDVNKPYWMVFRMDWHTFAFFLSVCLAAAVLFGLAPALHVSRTNLGEVLKEGGRTGSSGVRARRWTSSLVVAEIALTLVLLAGAGFMMRSFMSMYRLDVGVDTAHLVTMQMILPGRKYPTPQDRTMFLQRVEERLSSPSTDVVAVSTASTSPFSGGSSRQIEIDGRRAADAQRRPTVTMLSVGSRYFDAIGVRLIAGRAFTTADGEPGHESVIVNQRLADLYFHGSNPVGHRLRLIDDQPGAPEAAWLTIVALVPNVRQRSNNQEREPDPVAYTPHRQNDDMTRTAVILARTRSEPPRAAQALRREIQAVDPDMALFNVRTMDDLLAEQRWSYRVFGTMFSVFAFIALVLAAVGLYGVTSYLVTQHTRDIGVRMVLGAQSKQVVWLFLRRGVGQLAIGLTVGVAGAFGVGRILQSLLFQTSPRDPVTLVAIGGLLIVVGVAACAWPARRATRLDPVVALRHE